MFSKIKNIITWPFRVDNRSLSDIGFIKSFLIAVILTAALFSLYKSATYYYDIYYLPIDAKMAVDDYFVQDNYNVLRGVYIENVRVVSAAVNLHFNSIKEKPQIVTIIEPPYTTEDFVVERANQLFNEIGIGNAEYNNGVLIYISGNRDFSFKIEVGYGLEDVITDSKSGMIIDKAFEQIGGKDNLNQDNLNKVLLYIFSEIANIVAEKYNVDISKDLNVSNYKNIVYYEPLDNLGLFLKYYTIILSAFILLLLFSKRYLIMIALLPLLILTIIFMLFGDVFLLLIVFIFHPIIYTVYLAGPDKKKTVKINKSNNIKSDNTDTANNTDTADNTEILDKVNNDSNTDTVKKAVESNPVKHNLLKLTFIPSRVNYDYKNMPYQFVLFYTVVLLILSFYFLSSIYNINYNLINEEFINPKEATVNEKLRFYTNITGIGGYEKQDYNTYILDNTFDKELYGINYLFQKSEYKPKIVAVFNRLDNYSSPLSAEQLYTKYKLDKLENKNGLLIVYTYNLNTFESNMDIIAGDGLKNIITQYDIEEIKMNALKHSYNPIYELNIDNYTIIKEPDDYLANMIDSSVAKAEKILGQDINKENTENAKKNIDTALKILNLNGDFARVNLIMTYKMNGNCVKVLQEAVEQSANIIAKAYKINLDDNELLSYYNYPYKLEMSSECKDSIFTLVVTVLLFLVVLVLLIIFKSLLKLAIYGFMASALLFMFYYDDSVVSILLLLVIVVLMGILVFKNNTSGGGRSGFSFRSSSGGRSFSSSRRSSSGFGGFSRSRSSRSFRVCGRSGGGCSFRR